jgi:hypothetical protein
MRERQIGRRLSKFEQDWNDLPSARMDRYLTYTYGTPLVSLVVLWMLAIEQWVAAAVVATLLPVCLWAGSQVPGSKVQRFISRRSQK